MGPCGADPAWTSARRHPTELFRWLKMGYGPKSLFRWEVNSPLALGNRCKGAGVEGESHWGALSNVGLLPAHLRGMLEYGLWKAAVGGC